MIIFVSWKMAYLKAITSVVLPAQILDYFIVVGVVQEDGGHGDLGVPHLVQQDQVSAVCLLGHGGGHAGNSHSRHRQEDAEDTCQGDSQGREDQTRVFQIKRRIRIWQR